MDFLAVVYFSAEAKVLEDLNFMAPAYSGFRKLFVEKVNELEPGGGTNYQEGLERAFTIADTNYKNNYDTGCQTAFVFLTDGEQTEGSSNYVEIIESRIAKKGGGGKKRSETFIVIGLGDDLTKDTQAQARKKLLDMSCKGQGIYKQVADATGDITAERVEYNLQEALSLFSTYFTQKNTMNQRDIVTYSEVYGSSWDGKSEGTHPDSVAHFMRFICRLLGLSADAWVHRNGDDDRVGAGVRQDCSESLEIPRCRGHRCGCVRP
jgi:hypothetical protein